MLDECNSGAGGNLKRGLDIDRVLETIMAALPISVIILSLKMHFIVT
jgi:hypothetical protein